TFVEDVAIVTDAFAILTRPGAPSRTGEVGLMRATLTDFFDTVFEIEAPGTLDGGDICQAGRYFFCGLSERTNEAGAKQLAGFLREFGYTSILIDIKTDGETGAAATESLLHLKSGIAYLGDNRLVTVESMAGRKEFAGYDLVLVDQAETYAANCIRVNNH